MNTPGVRHVNSNFHQVTHVHENTFDANGEHVNVQIHENIVTHMNANRHLHDVCQGSSIPMLWTHHSFGTCDDSTLAAIAAWGWTCGSSGLGTQAGGGTPGTGGAVAGSSVAGGAVAGGAVTGGAVAGGAVTITPVSAPATGAIGGQGWSGASAMRDAQVASDAGHGPGAASGMGSGASGMGSGASGMGSGASGMGSGAASAAETAPGAAAGSQRDTAAGMLPHTATDHPLGILAGGLLMGAGLLAGVPAARALRRRRM
ncbi:MAG: hypothetical protein K6T67_13705 [Alicyclobacillus sp.]|nr:hypothetical protein [Alicyclobacillus sp.]